MRSCLICDDHAMMREALAGAVEMHWPDASIALAADFPSGWKAAAARPDLILCDLGMPGATPVEGIRRMRATCPDSPLLVITANEEDGVLLALFDLGIAGLAPKSSSGAIVETGRRLPEFPDEPLKPLWFAPRPSRPLCPPRATLRSLRGLLLSHRHRGGSAEEQTSTRFPSCAQSAPHVVGVGSPRPLGARPVEVGTRPVAGQAIGL